MSITINEEDFDDMLDWVQNKLPDDDIFRFYVIRCIIMAKGYYKEVILPKQLSLLPSDQVNHKDETTLKEDTWKDISTAPKIEGHRFLAKRIDGFIFITDYQPEVVVVNGCYGLVDSYCEYYEDMEPILWREIPD